MKWHLSGTVIGRKYLGEVEADTMEEAIEKGWKLCHVSLCHQCSDECEDAEIDEVFAEAIESDEE